MITKGVAARTGAFILLLLVFLLFTYKIWWLAPLGSVVMIGFAWAIHFGWNLVFIDGLHLISAAQVELSEPQMFNHILGSLPVLLLVSLAAGLSFLLYRLYHQEVYLAESDVV